MIFLRSLFTVSAFTMLSRMLGFARQIFIAGVLGASPIADAFWSAFRIPNMFRRMLAEGSFHAALIPLLHGKQKQSLYDYKQFIGDIALGLIFVLSTLTALVLIFAPFFVWLLVPGFFTDPSKADLTIFFTRIMFPYLFIMSLLGLVSGVLNSHKQFVLTSLAPTLLNVTFIAALIIWSNSNKEQMGFILCLAVLLGGLLQLALVYFGWLNYQKKIFYNIKKKNGKLRYNFNFSRLLTNCKSLFVLGAPGFIAAGALQINVVIGTNIASRQDGAVSWLVNADQLYQLPLALIGIALGMVLLPNLSMLIKNNNHDKAVNTLNEAILVGNLLAIPAAVGLFLLAPLIIFALFSDLASDALALVGSKKSLYTANDIAQTAWALKIYAVGLPFFVLKKILSPAFFARENTMIPMKFALVSIAVNIVTALVLYPWLGFVAVPLATVFASFLEVVLLFISLTLKKYFKVSLKNLVQNFVIIIINCISLLLLLYVIKYQNFITDMLFGQTWLTLLGLIIFFVVVYAIFCFSYLQVIKYIKRVSNAKEF